MAAFFISILVSGLGGILAWVFRAELANLFATPSPGQKTVDIERQMAQDVADKPDVDQAIQRLRDGDA